MTEREIAALVEALVPRLAEKLADALLDPRHDSILPFRLTVRQFAACVQRCDETVRCEIRNGDIEADGRPYLIHPRELAKHQVDPEMAMSRLRSAGLLPGC